MAMAGLADIHNNSWGRTGMRKKKAPIAIGWQSSPDPTDKQTDGEDQVVALARALELMSGSSMCERPPAKQGTCLKIC